MICSNRVVDEKILIDHKIIFTAILPLPLVQEGHLSVAGKSMFGSTD